MELGDDGQQDTAETTNHLAAQPRCNGKTIATRTSYSANTADLAATRYCPGLVAVIPCATEFDWWEKSWPDGTRYDLLLGSWAVCVHDIDIGHPLMFHGKLMYEQQQATLDGQKRSEDCLKLFPTLQPVDEDQNYSMCQLALRRRESNGKHGAADDYNTMSFHDDRGTNGHNSLGSSTSSLLLQLRRYTKPVQYWASWLDANTANGAISRFLSAPGNTKCCDSHRKQPWRLSAS